MYSQSNTKIIHSTYKNCMYNELILSIKEQKMMKSIPPLYAPPVDSVSHSSNMEIDYSSSIHPSY